MTGALITVEPHVLTICAYPEFAPFAFERDGEIVGTDITLLRRFADEEGLRVRIVKCDFCYLWQRPGRDECDVAAAGIAALPGRDLGKRAVWSAPYIAVRRSLLIRSADADRLRSPADFRGKKIVATPHSTADFDARQRYQPWGADLILTVPSQRAVVEALLRHDIDAFAEGTVSNQYLIDQYGADSGHPSSKLLMLADVHDTEQVETLHFAVRAADIRLVTRLNAFISAHPYSG
jgi:ABC-type amino acid transport substrate-binding protein